MPDQPEASMWSSSISDLGMTSMEADRRPACSDPPAESCADAGCPVHGWDHDADPDDHDDDSERTS